MPPNEQRMYACLIIGQILIGHNNLTASILGVLWSALGLYYKWEGEK